MSDDTKQPEDSPAAAGGCSDVRRFKVIIEVESEDGSCECVSSRHLKHDLSIGSAGFGWCAGVHVADALLGIKEHLKHDDQCDLLRAIISGFNEEQIDWPKEPRT